MHLHSWNVNGIRAIEKKGFVPWLLGTRADVICVQETKALPSDLSESVLSPDGYRSVWHSAKRRGYSGVATYFRKGFEPVRVEGLNIGKFDDEGRVQVLDFDSFVLVNAYFPNSQPERARIQYKLEFCRAIGKLGKELREAGKPMILCGDFNIAHREIDLARPKENVDNPGFYPEERRAMDRLLRAGYVDTFRHLTPGRGHYTWWSYRTNARARNIGWRLDYHVIDEGLLPRLQESRIHSDVQGSDHCPVSVAID
ncbi:MAG TPA: exodeoxyribonuclease III [Candidatus Hydrogenedentes bacterium]|nr:exodeoxyribonuclease III [Candidatus Hydrogenedentota bacterium]HQE83278.1 exodeoxyribonuclease III [Candidatus Hydrogenedentota bacterium]HQH50806.1 exodeoxyribonuclease III [Candidatus Hydrogenedentota bacterium]HQM47744.1 exodeoxyribonuclease III [Candidatus Hydrogenedentota bacterium]